MPKDPIKAAEARKKMSIVKLGELNPAYGKHLTNEQKQNLSDKNTGKIISPETCAKISKALTGIKRSDATKELLRNINLGKKRPPEDCAKISIALSNRVWLASSCEKISISKKGKKLSVEHRNNISKATIGKPRSNTKERNGAWKGGISFEPYCEKFTKEFRERVRVFFDYTCQICGHVWSVGERHLAVHHVNFNKDSCCNEDVEPLFVPLCTSCHTKTNFDREHWEKYFTSIITERYDGGCYLSKDEMEEYKDKQRAQRKISE